MKHAENAGSYLDAPHGIASWLLTKDHKRIAMLYRISITIFFLIGGLFATGNSTWCRLSSRGCRPKLGVWRWPCKPCCPPDTRPTS